MRLLSYSTILISFNLLDLNIEIDILNIIIIFAFQL